MCVNDSCGDKWFNLKIDCRIVLNVGLLWNTNDIIYIENNYKVI